MMVLDGGRHSVGLDFVIKVFLLRNLELRYNALGSPQLGTTFPRMGCQHSWSS